MGITVNHHFIAKARQLSNDFEDQQLVVKAMIRMMRKTLKKIQTIHVKDLLYMLHERNMGTTDVINLANRLIHRRGSRRDTIVKLTMKAKIKDAWSSLRKERYEEQMQWRELRRVLQEKNKVQAYNVIWAEERNKYFAKLREKRKRKVAWIKNKYYKREAIPDTFKGVTVKDQPIDRSFETEPVVYGNVEISEDEKSVLRIHPKYTVFDRVDPIDCEAEIEKSITKLRWARKEEDRKEQNRENGITEEPRKETFNIDERKFDFRHTRSTELPFNIRTGVPDR